MITRTTTTITTTGDGGTYGEIIQSGGTGRPSGSEPDPVWWWLKSGKVQTDTIKNGRPAFSEARVAEIKASMLRAAVA